MKLALRSVDHAVQLLVEYNGGKRTAAEEARLLAEATAWSARDFKRLGVERYYRESEAIKYDLLWWHLRSLRWKIDYYCLKYLQRPGTLVDFGAGIGLSAFAYASAGFAVTAVEESLDSDTVRFALFLQDRLGVRGVTFTDALPPGPFDNATAIDVFEHFPDWTGPARALVGTLRPGGVLAMRAPFATEESEAHHPQHFESPVHVGTFLASLGLDPIAPGIWTKAR